MLVEDREEPKRNYLKIKEDKDCYAGRESHLKESGQIEQVVSMFNDFILWECKDKK